MENIEEMTANDLALKLKDKTKMTNQEIRDKTHHIIKQNKPLITSKKTALLYYANQQNDITLIEKTPPELDIKNIVPEMNDLTFQCKIREINKFTYTKQGKTRQGCEITLFDDTGTISMMVWGEQVDKIKNSLEGEPVTIENAYSNKYQGEIQVNYGKETKIKID